VNIPIIEMLNKKTILKTMLLRVDASHKIGLGHAMRCFALAQAWRRAGGVIIMVMRTADQILQERLSVQGIRVALLNGVADEISYINKLVEQNSVDWIVIDGYQFDSKYIRSIKENNKRVMLIDDDATLSYYSADIILNQNLHAQANIYKGKTEAQLLIGSHYALMREEFLDKRSWQRDFPQINLNVLFTFGGADPQNNTLAVIKCLIGSLMRGFHDMRIRIIVGGANNKGAMIGRMVKDIKNIQIYNDVSEMGEHIRWCDIIASGAGSTVWESALCQTPMILIPSSDIERKVAVAMMELGASVSFLNIQETGFQCAIDAIFNLRDDYVQRVKLGKTAGKLVDGKGATRVVDALLNFIN
jgi:UDP-2,4-diacetamido-2,4,6-trideoxy-beta-L-altropyranose hydrolase